MEPSTDAEVIICEVDELSVVAVFCDIDEFSVEVVVIFGDIVILNIAPYNIHCSISSGSYCKTHRMPSVKSETMHSSANNHRWKPTAYRCKRM